MDINKTQSEKARWEQHKNVICCLEQILEATLHKTANVQLPTSHLTNHPSKKTRHVGTIC